MLVSYDVFNNIRQAHCPAAHHVMDKYLNPRLLSELASDDVTSTIYRALTPERL